MRLVGIDFHYYSTAARLINTDVELLAAKPMGTFLFQLQHELRLQFCVKHLFERLSISTDIMLCATLVYLPWGWHSARTTSGGHSRRFCQFALCELPSICRSLGISNFNSPHLHRELTKFPSSLKIGRELRSPFNAKMLCSALCKVDENITELRHLNNSVNYSSEIKIYNLTG